MKSIFQNPLTIWLKRLVRAKLLEYRYRGQFLKIGYLSNVNQCNFGVYNTIYDFVSLNRCTLGDFTYIASGTSMARTKIGKFCSIGSDCKIGLGRHPTKEFVSTHPIFFSTKNQAQISFADADYFDELGEINIGNDVWLGVNVVVVDGVTVGDGAIIGAGSVVTKDVPPYGIVGGVPAKLIRYRFDRDQIEELQNLKWWDMDSEVLKEEFKSFHNVERFLQVFHEV